MRIRQVKPAFWADAKIASLPHDARLFYIGLWMMADDDGWLRWDVPEIGKELYGFEGRVSREKRIDRMAEAIGRALPGKLAIHSCGHAELPKVAVHQHLAGTTRRVTTVHSEHSRDCPRLPATPRPVMVSDSDVEVSNGRGSAREGATEMAGSKDPMESWRETGARLRAVAN